MHDSIVDARFVCCTKPHEKQTAFSFLKVYNVPTISLKFKSLFLQGERERERERKSEERREKE